MIPAGKPVPRGILAGGCPPRSLVPSVFTPQFSSKLNSVHSQEFVGIHLLFNALMSLPTIFDTCRPRADVLAGTIRDDEFMADLSRVVNGTAPTDYLDPA